MPASPDLMNLGLASVALPVRTIDPLPDLVELASNVSSVAIQDWRVSVGDLSRVVENNDLSGEVSAAGGRLVLGVGGDVATLDVLDRDVLDVEANVVSGHSLGHCSNTSDLVDILEGQTEGLVGGPLGWDDGVKGIQKSGAGSLALLALNGPSLVPGHVLGGLQHVISMPSRDGDEWNGGRVVADLLDESRHLLPDLLETSLRIWGLGRVHLVDTNDQLLDTEGVSEQSVLTGLAVLGDTSLEFTGTGGDDQDTAISLGGSSDHVLDEITMSGGIDDGDVVLASLELPQGN